MADDVDAESFKQKGNDCFKKGDFHKAKEFYTAALDNCENLLSPETALVYFKNRAACNIKLGLFDEALSDVESGLKINPRDIKCLFRKCQTLEKQEKLSEAIECARELLKLDPRDTSVQELMTRLSAAVIQKRDRQNSASNLIHEVLSIVCHQDSDIEKVAKAFKNLVAVAYQKSTSAMLLEQGGVVKMVEIIDEKDVGKAGAAFRVLEGLASHGQDSAEVILSLVTIDRILKSISQSDEDLSDAASRMLDMAFHNYLGRPDDETEARKWMYKGDKKQFLAFCLPIFGGLDDNSVSGYGRDNIIKILFKNTLRYGGGGVTLTLMDAGLVTRLLRVASSCFAQGQLPTTDNTLLTTALSFERLNDDLDNEKEINLFTELCKKFFCGVLKEEHSDTKVLLAICCLLQGPSKIGLDMIDNQDILETMLLQAKDGDDQTKLLAIEAMNHVAGSKKNGMALLGKGVEILNNIYLDKLSSDSAKVRSLVTLCKLGSAGGTDASVRPLEDHSLFDFASSARHYLISSNKDLQKFAIECFSYLTFDGDIKEELCYDDVAMQAVITVAKQDNHMAQYSIACVLVNLTNSYDKTEIDDEMRQLAEFSKQHIPEKHPMDMHEYVVKRVSKLVSLGTASALVNCHKVESDRTRELFSRVFNALAESQTDRGLLVQQGTSKALLSLANKGSSAGKTFAAQALARIGITINPDIAFPGQRLLETIRPLLRLLSVEHSGLQNFESMMCLTNIFSVSPAARKRLFAEKGLLKIENYMYEDHDMLSRAATECLCNLAPEDDILPYFTGSNDRVKFWTLLSNSDDNLEVVLAASGGLASLTRDKSICQKVVEVGCCIEMLEKLCSADNVDLSVRGCFIVANLMEASKEIAEKVVGSQLLEILMALTKLEDNKLERVKPICESVLDKAVEYGLIQRNVQS